MNKHPLQANKRPLLILSSEKAENTHLQETL